MDYAVGNKIFERMKKPKGAWFFLRLILPLMEIAKIAL
jgi:hypothetical protein